MLIALLAVLGVNLIALVAFAATVAVMTFVILGVKFIGPSATTDPVANGYAQWTKIQINFSSAAPPEGIRTLTSWWYTPLGVLVTLVVGGLLSLRHPPNTTPKPEAMANAKAA